MVVNNSYKISSLETLETVPLKSQALTVLIYRTLFSFIIHTEF